MTDMWFDTTCEGGPIGKQVSSLGRCYNMSDEGHTSSQMYSCNTTHATTYMYLDGACGRLLTTTVQAIGTCTDAMFLGTKVTECTTPGSGTGSGTGSSTGAATGTSSSSSTVTSKATSSDSSSASTSSGSSSASASSGSSSTSTSSDSTSASTSSGSSSSTSSGSSSASTSYLLSSSTLSSSTASGEAEEGNNSGSGSMAEHVVVAVLAVTLFALVALVAAYRFNWLPEGASSAMDRVLQREHRHRSLADFDEEGIN